MVFTALYALGVGSIQISIGGVLEALTGAVTR